MRDDRINADEAKATVPLPDVPLAVERATLPLTGQASLETSSGSVRTTPPERIDRFEIRSWLGSGAFGDVYRAYDPQLDREIALKVAKPGSLDTPERLARFLREAKAAANLRHPNIIPVYESGRDGERLYLATAYIAGRTLEAVIGEANERGDRIPLATAAQVVRKLADALAYAHALGIVHRDVKPANVMVDESGEPMLLDFGLAARAEIGQERLTQDGQGMGTPAYMAPEQADGQGVAASDQYSLGCTLYELITGRTPFAGGPAQQIFLHRTQPVVSPRRIRPEVPRDLATVVLKCVEKRPDQRYGTCAEMAEDLRRYLDGVPVRARPIGPLERVVRWARRNPLVAASLTFAVLALLVGTAASLAQRNEARWQAHLAGEAADEAKRETARANDNKRLADEETAKALKEKAAAQEERDRSQVALYAVNLDRGKFAIEQGKFPIARQYLDQCDWDLRGWEHRFLWSQFNSRQTFFGHTGGVGCVQVTPDGTQVVSGSSDGTVKVWDLGTGQELATLAGHKGAVTSVCVTSDGKCIISGGADKTVRVWDARTRTLRDTLTGHTRTITSVCVSPDGSQIVSGSEDRTIRIWDASTKQTTRTLTGHKEEVRSICMTPDGTRVVSASRDGTVRVWDATSGKELRTFTDGYVDVGFACATLTPDGAHLVATEFNWPSVIIWDLTTGRELRRIHDQSISMFWDIRVTPDGKCCVTTDDDGAVRVWDARTGKLIRTFTTPVGSVHSVSVTPDGTRIVSGRSDGTVRIWDAEPSNKEFRVFARQENDYTCVCSTPDGTRLLVAGGINNTGVGTQVLVLDAMTGQEIVRSQTGHINRVHAVCPMPDGTRIVSAGGFRDPRGALGSLGGRRRRACAIKVWDAQTGKELLQLNGHIDSVTSVCVTPDGKHIISGGDDSTVRVWDAATGELVHTLSLPQRVFAVCVTADGTRIVGAGGDGLVRVWERPTWKLLHTLAGHTDAVTSVCALPGGDQIVTGGRDTTVRVWDLTDGKPLRLLTGHTKEVTSVGVMPDGPRIISGSLDNTLKIWHPMTGKELLSLTGHNGGVAGVCVSPDGTRIFSASKDPWQDRLTLSPGELLVWHAGSGRAPLTLVGLNNDISGIRVTPDGQRVFAWDKKGAVRAWHTRTGEPADSGNPPERSRSLTATTPDGSTLVAQGKAVWVIDAHTSGKWPLPTRAQRIWHHTQQADRAEKAQQPFAAAFHLGRLLLDDPNNADVKRRRDEALKRHATALTATTPPVKP